MLIKFRFLIICFAVVSTAVAGWHLPEIHTKNNQRIFFEDDDPNLLTLQQFEDSFGKVDNLIVAVTGKSVYEKEFLVQLKELTERSWMLPYVSRSQSITNFQYTAAANDGLIIRDLIPDPHNLTEAELTEIKKFADEEERIKNILVGENNRTAGVLLTFQLPRIHDSLEIPEVMKALNDMLSTFEKQYPELLIHVSGTMATDYAFVQSSRRDLTTLIPLCFLTMVVIVGLFSGGFSASLLTSLCGVMAILFTMGCAAWIGIALSSATSIAPIVILILTIAHSVHILDRYVKDRAKGAPTKNAASETFKFNRYQILVATITTSLGFLSFNFSHVPPFRDLGNLAAIGTAAAFFYSVVFLPCVLSYISVKTRRPLNLYPQLLRGFALWLKNYNTLWVAVFCVGVLTISLGVFKNDLNDVILNYFDDSIEYRRDTDFIVDNLTGLYQIHYILDSGKPGGVTEPLFLRDVERFVEWFRAHPKNISVSSIGSVFKRLNMNLHGDDPSWYKFPQSRDLAAQYLLLYEMSIPYGLDVNTEVNINKSKLRVTVAFETLSSRDLVEINNQAESWVAKNAQNIVSATGTGIALIFARISAINMKSMIMGTVLALVAISVILIFAFRSIKFGMLSLIPNLIPLGIGFGLWGYFYGQIGLSLSVVSGMTLGIIVDDTVHFISRYMEARKENRLTGIDALLHTYEAVGQPLIVTSVSLAAGFMILTLSSFYLNASLGLLTSVIIIAALLCDLVLLPSILLFADKIGQNSAS